MPYIKINVKEISIIIKKILLCRGLNSKHADILVDSLIDSEQRGIPSHGLMRLKPYVSRIDAGLINVNPQIKIKSDEGSSLIKINGDNGLGQIVTKRAVDKCIEKAEKRGVGMASITNSNHFGSAGYFSRYAARKGYIAFVASNASPNMPPFGGIKPLLGTNPFSISFPAGKYDNFTLDIAMSSVSKGKIRMYCKENKKIPLGWAMDLNGNDTTDPMEAIKGGLLPMGGYKGYGLAIVVDMFCAILSGSKLSFESESLFKSKDVAGTGHFISVIKIQDFLTLSEFNQRVEGWFDELKKSDLRPNVKEIYIPGEIENNKEREVNESLILLEETLRDIESI